MSDPAPPPPNASRSPAGWYPDPHRRYEYRYFNGTEWTADVSSSGQRQVDTPTPSMPATSSTSSTSATVALVMGIVAIVLGWVPLLAVLLWIIALVALIIGIKAKRSSSERAVGAIITSSLGLVIATVGVILTVILFRAVFTFISPAEHQVAISSCEILESSDAMITGTLTNLSDHPADFTVFTIVDDQFDLEQAISVAPGTTIDWVTIVEVPPSIRVCNSDLDLRLIVHGPLPFGVEVEPIRDTNGDWSGRLEF